MPYVFPKKTEGITDLAFMSDPTFILRDVFIRNIIPFTPSSLFFFSRTLKRGRRLFQTQRLMKEILINLLPLEKEEEEKEEEKKYTGGTD